MNNKIYIENKEDFDFVDDLFRKYDIDKFTDWFDLILHRMWIKEEEEKDRELIKAGKPIIKLKESAFPSLYKLWKAKKEAMEEGWFIFLNLQVVAAIGINREKIIDNLKERGMCNLADFIKNFEISREDSEKDLMKIIELTEQHTES